MPTVQQQKPSSVNFDEKIQETNRIIIVKGSTSNIAKAKESSEPMEQALPTSLNQLVDNFM